MKTIFNSGAPRLDRVLSAITVTIGLCTMTPSFAANDVAQTRYGGNQRLYDGHPAVEFSVNRIGAPVPELHFMLGQAAIPDDVSELQFEVYCNDELVGNMTSSRDDEKWSYVPLDDIGNFTLNRDVNTITVVSPTREYPRIPEMIAGGIESQALSVDFASATVLGDDSGISSQAIDLITPPGTTPSIQVDAPTSYYTNLHFNEGETVYFRLSSELEDDFIVDVIPVTPDKTEMQCMSTTNVSRPTDGASPMGPRMALLFYPVGKTGNHLIAIRSKQSGMAGTITHFEIKVFDKNGKSNITNYYAQGLAYCTKSYTLDIPADGLIHYIAAKPINAAIAKYYILMVEGGACEYGRTVGHADNSSLPLSVSSQTTGAEISMSYYFPATSFHVISKNGQDEKALITTDAKSVIKPIESPIITPNAAKKTAAPTSISTLKRTEVELGTSCEFAGKCPTRVIAYNLGGSKCGEVHSSSGYQTLPLSEIGINKSGYYLLMLYADGELSDIQKIKVK